MLLQLLVLKILFLEKLIDKMFNKNMFLSDGSCVNKTNKNLTNVILLLDIKNSIHWNIKKKKKKKIS